MWRYSYLHKVDFLCATSKEKPSDGGILGTAYFVQSQQKLQYKLQKKKLKLSQDFATFIQTILKYNSMKNFTFFVSVLF